MRFETKFDRWMAPLLAISAVLICVVLTVRILVPRPHSEYFWFPGGVAVLPAFLRLIMLPWGWPQYYEVREDGLFLRQGLSRTLIPYASLVSLQSVPHSRSLRVFSAEDRLLVLTEDGKRFTIAVAEEERFLAEVSKRSPQLERRDSGFAIPFVPLLSIV